MSARRAARLEVEALLEPSVTPVTEGDAEVTVLVRLRQNAAADTPAPPIHLCLAPLGPGAVNAAPVLRALDALRPGDRISLPGAGGHTLAPGEGPQACKALVEAGFVRPGDTAAAALNAASELLQADRRHDTHHRVLLVPHSPVVEAMESLLAAATALTERQLGIDVVTTSPATDLGLMIRLANLGGGEVTFADTPDALEAAVRHRLIRLAQATMIEPRLELDFVPGIVPGRMYRVSPAPIFLGNVRLTPTDRRLVLDPGPVAVWHEPVFLLTLTVPKRRVGRYRLMEVAVRHRAGSRVVTSAQTSVVHTTTDDPNEAGFVEAAVVAARDRVEPVGWVEEAGRAFLEGDHRRVATTLERMARRMLELGRGPDAQAVVEARGRYLRSGHLDRSELNRLRRVAGAA